LPKFQIGNPAYFFWEGIIYQDEDAK